MFVFHSEVPHFLKLVDDTDVDLKDIVKTIKAKCSERSAKQETYRTRLCWEDDSVAGSDMPLDLLAQLSPKLDPTNTTLLNGNMTTATLTNRLTKMQN